MSDPSVVVGEGTYGCVHSPPLYCKGSTRRKPFHVSKFMTTANATSEMKEYALIHNADRALNYYLGKPTICKVDTVESNREAIQKCSIIHKNKPNLINNLEKYSLIIMKDGGINLGMYSKQIKEWKDTPANVQKFELFMIEAQRILKGLTVFAANDMVHHDLKQQNIVYNESTNRLNFIDFGLMCSKSRMVQDLKKGRHYLAKYHWSFPFELEFLNKTKYMTFARIGPATRTVYLDTIISGILERPDDDFSSTITTLMSMISNNNPSTKSYQGLFKLLLGNYTNLLRNSIKYDDEKYDEFMHLSVNTIDSYGVGIAFLNVLKNSHNLLTRECKGEFLRLFIQMVESDVYVRKQPDDALAEFENILFKHGILDRHNKHFVNHVLTDKMAIPNSINKAIQNVAINIDSPSPLELDKMDLTVYPDCPEGKEYKSTTRRCVKKCKLGYKRNDQFKCIKTVKTIRSVSTTPERIGSSTDEWKSTVPPVHKPRTPSQIPNFSESLPRCPEGKELNPLTKRCKKNCKPGFKRNTTFKCRKA